MWIWPVSAGADWPYGIFATPAEADASNWRPFAFTTNSGVKSVAHASAAQARPVTTTPAARASCRLWRCTSMTVSVCRDRRGANAGRAIAQNAANTAESTHVTRNLLICLTSTRGYKSQLRRPRRRARRVNPYPAVENSDLDDDGRQPWADQPPDL